MRLRLYAFGAALLVLVLGLAYQHVTGPETPPAAVTAPAPSAPRSQVPADAAGPEKAVRGYLTALLDASLPYQEWREATLACATARLAADLTRTPREAIPDATLTRVHAFATTVDFAAVRAWLSDGTVVDVDAILAGGQWRVDEVRPR